VGCCDGVVGGGHEGRAYKRLGQRWKPRPCASKPQRWSYPRGCGWFNVDGLGKDVELSYGGSEFQLAVGAGAVWVAAGDDAFGDGGGPAATPEHGQDLSIAEWDKVYPSQTEAQCVTSTVSGRGSVQNNFRDLRRARTHIFDKNGKVL
jgi:hypothetical protein